MRYEFNNYPRDNQKPANGCEIVDSYKNHDDADTWGGALVGSREAIIETLMDWGEPVIEVTTTPVDRDRAEELLDGLDEDENED